MVLRLLYDRVKTFIPGQPQWHIGLAPPAAQGAILETRDWVPRGDPCVEPASPSACVSAYLSLSEWINKSLKKKYFLSNTD